MWNVIGMMALVLSTSNVVHAEEVKSKMQPLTLISEFKALDEDVASMKAINDSYRENDELDQAEFDRTYKKLAVDAKDLSAKLENIDCKGENAKLKMDCRSALNIFEEMQTAAKDFEYADAYIKEQTSADGSADNACKYNNIIKNASAVLAHERKVGKVTGVVNMVTMHDAGNAVIESESRRADAVAKYKKATGKAFNFQKMCK